MLEHLKKLVHIFRNRYLTATLLFIVWITFFIKQALFMMCISHKKKGN